MGAVEDVRQVSQDFLAPELREIRGALSSIEKRLESLDKRLDSQDKRLDGIEEANRVRFESIMQRLEQIQQSFAFDKRLSTLEEDKRRSA
jgi:flagellar capping protein FliD